MAQILLDKDEFEKFQKLSSLIESKTPFVVSHRGYKWHLINVWTESEAVRELSESNENLQRCCDMYLAEILDLKEKLNSKK